MRFATMIGPVLLLATMGGCEKTDPLYCSENPGASGCAGRDGDVTTEDMSLIDSDNGIDARACFGADNYAVCLASAPSTPVVLADNVPIDTDSDPLCKPPPAQWTTAGQPDACFIIGTSINLANHVVTGDKPLVLLASNAVTISGILDVASHRVPLRVGPGAPWGDCPQFPTAPADNNIGNSGGGGGGAGASFMTVGRNGGAGDNLAFAGGTAAAAVTTGPVLLRPGCNGQDGGKGEADSPGGIGGGGGGALHIVAGNMITFGVNGAINASGAGALAAGDQAGGGGGGAGGMVVLYAADITGTAGTPGSRIIANGGGGGAGGNNGGGTPGNDPSIATPTTPAGTASGCGGCGTGGAGFAGSTIAQQGGDGGDPEGGGGGGGGGGYVVANKPLTNIVTSPAATIIPN